MARVNGSAWSDKAEAADWIGSQLLPLGAGQVTSVVPAGFGA